MSKKIEIYKGEELKVSSNVNDYQINSNLNPIYVNTLDIMCKIDDLDITYTIPCDKGYKIIFEV